MPPQSPAEGDGDADADTDSEPDGQTDGDNRDAEEDGQGDGSTDAEADGDSDEDVDYPEDCENNLHDGEETDVDCGGPDCPGCGEGEDCSEGSDCVSGVCLQTCQRPSCDDQVRNGDESDIDCGGSCRRCGVHARCRRATDCDTHMCRENTCEYPRSCWELAMEPDHPDSGSFRLEPEGLSTQREVYCDMETDGGGWTLVASTHGTALRDERSGYYDDLRSLGPRDGHTGVWSGLRQTVGRQSDIRFSCKHGPQQIEMVVDLAFYGTSWYRTITSGSDAQSCFNESDGYGFQTPAPARRDLVGDTFLERGNEWDEDGYLEGEDECDSEDDFTVDLDDRGMDGNDETDPTDWGVDDDLRVCGEDSVPEGSGVWLIWIRESHPGCHNQSHDGEEAGMDCGGPCPPCAEGTGCESDYDCESLHCDGDQCSPWSCEDEERNGDETDEDCGGSCDGCDLGERCMGHVDCEFPFRCDGGRCRRPRSCAEIHDRRNQAESGVYTLRPGNNDHDLYCDMDTDSGGWTLVASSYGDCFNDRRTRSHYSELETVYPPYDQTNIWNGMRSVVPRMSDIRFSCKVDPDQEPMTVDLSFYNTSWYHDITEGYDYESCFNLPDAESVPPARTNNITGETRDEGEPWSSGQLVGELQCSDTENFAVDFDDHGVGDTLESTDWGENEGDCRCGTESPDPGSWFIWVR